MVATRRALIQTSQGLSLVDPYMPAYFPHERVKDFVEKEKHAFFNSIESRLRARGLLFDGIPGVGKTAGAKYIAKQWGIPLFRIDATFQDAFVGRSENNFDMALKTAEAAAPAVLLFDEVEKFFAGAGGESWGGMMRVMGSLLWWLQEHRSRVLTVMTTNKKKSLPPELYREGRIDDVIEIPPLKNKDEILSVALTVWESFLGKESMPDDLIDTVVNSAKVDWKGDGTSGVTPMHVTAVVTAFVKEHHGG